MREEASSSFATGPRRFAPRKHTGTRPTCHFAPNMESSLDTYRIIAARLPFYNSQGIPGNTRRILIFRRANERGCGATGFVVKSTGDTQGCFIVRCIHIEHRNRDFGSDILNTLTGSRMPRVRPLSENLCFGKTHYLLHLN